MLSRKIAIFNIFFVLIWGLWWFGIFDCVWDSYQTYRLKPNLKIHITGRWLTDKELQPDKNLHAVYFYSPDAELSGIFPFKEGLEE